MSSSTAEQLDQSSGHDASISSSSSASSPPKQSSKPAKQSLSWISITDPKQAKNKKNKRAVRSHAMYDYAASKKRQDDKQRFPSVTKNKSRAVVRETGDDSDDFDQLLAAYAPTEGAAKGLTAVRELAQSLIPFATGVPEDQYLQRPGKHDPSRYHRALLALKRHDSKDGKRSSVLLQDDETLELVWKAGFVKPYSIRGLGDADPFFVLPQFRNPLIYMAELKSWCTRRFGTKAMAVHWVPALAQDRLTYLAALCVGATDMDVANGLPTDSALTVAVKLEVIELVNEQLAKPEKQYTDDTVMAIQLLLCGEIATGDEWVWGIHESGITRILLHRGGLQTLGINGDLAVVVFCVIGVMNVLRETQLREVYKRFVPVKQRSMCPKRGIPESPVYCPRSDFFSIAGSKYCSERLYDLLCDVRDLTEGLIDRERHFTSEEIPDGDLRASSKSSGPQGEDQEVLARIKALKQFDAATDAPSYSAWTFEACRIASLIYTTAIAADVSFSEAAFRVDLENPDATPSTGLLPHCLHQLRNAIANSPIGESWAEMIGVLFFITLVGGAASRKPRFAKGWTENDEWTRKYLISTAMRVMVLLCFEHGQATMLTLRRLNEVQRNLAPSIDSYHDMLGLEDIPG